MEKINFNFPSVCFHVEKILEVADVSDKHKTYKVQWAASWVSDVHLVGCHDLIEQFHHKSKNDNFDTANDRTGVISSSDGLDHCETGYESEFTRNEQLPEPISTETSCDNILNNEHIASQLAEYTDPYSGLTIIQIKEEQIEECDLDESISVTSSQVNLPAKYENDIENRDNLLNDVFGKECDMINVMGRGSDNDIPPVKSALKNTDVEITSKLSDNGYNLKLASGVLKESLGGCDPESHPEFLIDITEIQPDHSMDIETLTPKHDTIQVNDETGIRQLLPGINGNSVPPSPVSVLKKAKLTNSDSDSVVKGDCPKNILYSYTCQHCNENVVTIPKYLDHLKFFHSIIACKICLQEFDEKLACQMHQVDAHNLECPQCEVCGVVLSTRSSLKVHIKRKHTNERPHKCFQCEKSFSVSGDLKKHERLHTGEKPFSCEFCQQRFADSSQCFVHRRTKHPAQVPSLKCVLCGKKFPSKHHMKKHRCKGEINNLP